MVLFTVSCIIHAGIARKSNGTATSTKKGVPYFGAAWFCGCVPGTVGVTQIDDYLCLWGPKVDGPIPNTFAKGLSSVADTVLRTLSSCVNLSSTSACVRDLF